MEVAETRGGPQAHGWRRAYNLPPSLSHHSGLNSLARLAVWRQQRQLEAAKVSAAKAMQPDMQPEPA